ncbi:MAG: phosphotransferase [Pleomorphochaeta sp.]
MIDISNKDILVSYLKEKDIITNEMDYDLKYCAGGVSGTVAFLSLKDKDLIIKQALSKLKVKEDWLCDPSRMYVEQLSNKIYHDIAPDSVPEVLFYDEENYIYGRIAAPDHCRMWKEDLMDNILDFLVAKQSIEALVKVHNTCNNDKYVAKEFADKKVFYDLRISPYIEFTVEKHPEYKRIATFLSKELMEQSITLVHGDYSPKNIMCDQRKIFILDFEVAHYGNPVFDLAFFANHFVLKSIKFDNKNEAYLNMLDYMLDIYFKESNYENKDCVLSYFVKLLGMLMLARVDGKSPVEYLVDDEDKKQLVRDIAASLMTSNITDYKKAISLIKFLEK